MIQTFKKLCVGLCCIMMSIGLCLFACADAEEIRIKQIKQDYLGYLKQNNHWYADMKLEHITIFEEYGTYNGWTALSIGGAYHLHPSEDDSDLNISFVIGDVVFVKLTHDLLGTGVMFYKEGAFHDLKDAYEQELLTKDDLANLSQAKRTIELGNPQDVYFMENEIFAGVFEYEKHENEILELGNFDIEDIEELYMPEVGDISLVRIKLMNPGELNVMTAVESLKQCDFTLFAKPVFTFKNGPPIEYRAE